MSVWFSAEAAFKVRDGETERMLLSELEENGVVEVLTEPKEGWIGVTVRGGDSCSSATADEVMAKLKRLAAYSPAAFKLRTNTDNEPDAEWLGPAAEVAIAERAEKLATIKDLVAALSADDRAALLAGTLGWRTFHDANNQISLRANSRVLCDADGDGFPFELWEEGNGWEAKFRGTRLAKGSLPACIEACESHDAKAFAEVSAALVAAAPPANGDRAFVPPPASPPASTPERIDPAAVSIAVSGDRGLVRRIRVVSDGGVGVHLLFDFLPAGKRSCIVVNDSDGDLVLALLQHETLGRAGAVVRVTGLPPHYAYGMSDSKWAGFVHIVPAACSPQALRNGASTLYETGTGELVVDPDQTPAVLAQPAIRMFALLSRQGVACDEAGLCSMCDTPERRLAIEVRAAKAGHGDPPVPGAWTDVTGNGEVGCTECGRGCFDRIFIVAPTAGNPDDVLHRVCRTRAVGELADIYGMDLFETVETCDNLKDARTAAAHLGDPSPVIL